MVKTISAKIVADSIQENGCRLTTFTIIFPRFLLAELNTHRMLSRNSASSRARPFKVMLKDVLDDPFIPIRWMAAHKGMQGEDFLGEEASATARQTWLQARDAAVASARLLDEQQVTKQIVNRILEPFLWHEVIITGSEFDNFFALRAHADAEIHLAELAHKMLDAYNASVPKALKAGEWHIPFDGQFDESRIRALLDPQATDAATAASERERIDTIKLEIACARCARISYKPFGSEDNYDYAADRKLFKTLVDGGHFSPLEHVARAMTKEEWCGTAITRNLIRENGWCGNFRGFIQYRKTFVNENRKDSRIKAHA